MESNGLPKLDQDQGEGYLSVAELYDAHIDGVYRHIYRRCRDHALAEDVTQDTFVTALRTREPKDITVAWLKRVAANRLHDLLRRQTTYMAKLRLVGNSTGETSPGVVDRLHLEAALAEMTIDQRLILTLHYLDGLSVPEMAKELGRSVKSVEGLVTRARRQLRHQLGGSND